MKPMLAKPFEARFIQPPGYLQPKLDGVRLIWTGGEALSRTGKPILGVPLLVEHLREHYADFPLDGELYSHGRSFQSFLGAIRKTKNIDEDLTVAYCVYDHPVPGLTFEQRWRTLLDRVQVTDRLQLVATHLVESTEEVDALSQQFVGEGYEGAMFRNPEGLYAFGKRSKDLVKIKNFLEEEFEIVGITEKLTYDKVVVPEGTPGAKQYADGTWYKDENPRGVGTCGALTCVTKDGKKFDSGSGLSDALRDEYWKNPPIGKMVTVKFFEYTDDGVPRFPIFKAIRDYE